MNYHDNSLNMMEMYLFEFISYFCIMQNMCASFVLLHYVEAYISY